jgi:hypothetical protein
VEDENGKIDAKQRASSSFFSLEDRVPSAAHRHDHLKIDQENGNRIAKERIVFSNVNSMVNHFFEEDAGDQPKEAKLLDGQNEVEEISGREAHAEGAQAACRELVCAERYHSKSVADPRLRLFCGEVSTLPTKERQVTISRISHVFHSQLPSKNSAESSVSSQRIGLEE